MRAALLLLLACCGHASFPKSEPHELFGRALPDIRPSRTLDGVRIKREDLAGRVVVVKFFADYCEPCKRTLPEAERVHASHGDVIFIGISEDETAEQALGVVHAFGLTFPIIKDVERQISGRFRVSDMPITFVIDRLGTIRWVGGPTQTGDDLERAVEAAR